eukprot:gene521-2455_t
MYQSLLPRHQGPAEAVSSQPPHAGTIRIYDSVTISPAGFVVGDPVVSTSSVSQSAQPKGPHLLKASTDAATSYITTPTLQSLSPAQQPQPWQQAVWHTHTNPRPLMPLHIYRQAAHEPIQFVAPVHRRRQPRGTASSGAKTHPVTNKGSPPNHLSPTTASQAHAQPHQNDGSARDHMKNQYIYEKDVAMQCNKGHCVCTQEFLRDLVSKRVKLEQRARSLSRSRSRPRPQQQTPDLVAPPWYDAPSQPHSHQDHDVPVPTKRVLSQHSPLPSWADTAEDSQLVQQLYSGLVGNISLLERALCSQRMAPAYQQLNELGIWMRDLTHLSE